MASKWTCEEDFLDITNQKCWNVRCDGKYMGHIFVHSSIATMYRYAIPGQTYTPKAFPTVKRAMSAMRATLRWRRKTQRKAAGKATDTKGGEV